MNPLSIHYVSKPCTSLSKGSLEVQLFLKFMLLYVLLDVRLSGPFVASLAFASLMISWLLAFGDFGFLAFCGFLWLLWLLLLRNAFFHIFIQEFEGQLLII